MVVTGGGDAGQLDAATVNDLAHLGSEKRREVGDSPLLGPLRVLGARIADRSELFALDGRGGSR